MKLLLTSAGFTNKTISNALLTLTNKPFSKLNIVFIPTAANVQEGDKDWLVDDMYNCKELGFNVMDVLDIALFPKYIVQKRLEAADIIMFGGGNTFYLMEKIREVGLDTTLPELLKTRVYVGISAGSMVMTPSLALSQSERLYYEDMKESVTDESALHLVNFQVRPHLNSPYFPKVRLDYLEKLASEYTDPIYAIDDATAIVVDGDKTTVVSEGTWKLFNGLS